MLVYRMAEIWGVSVEELCCLKENKEPIMENKVNEYALKTREFLVDKLDFLDGEVQEFEPADNGGYGVAAMDVKWRSGIHLIIWQSLWRIDYYVVRNGEQISNTFVGGKPKADLFIYIQRLINDINSGRYDNKATPLEIHLKYVQERGLTGCMNNTKWDKVFGIIRSMEEETGKGIPIMYKHLSDTEVPIHYWTVGGDEYLNKGMYKYIEWLKIRPVVCECEYRGRLIEPEYRYYDFTSLLLGKMKAVHLRFEYLQQEKACMIYGYKIL